MTEIPVLPPGGVDGRVRPRARAGIGTAAAERPAADGARSMPAADLDPPAAAGGGGGLMNILDRTTARGLAFVRRRLSGQYPVDEFGLDAELADSVLMAPFRPLYDRWFRVEARGLEHVPGEGGALIVANHSGTLPLDAIMTTLALRDHHPSGRRLRPLGAHLLFETPFLGPLARKYGATVACVPDAERLLRGGELVGVWPEGYKGLGKPFRDRYKLQRFGRGGFVAAALRTGAPIVPTAIVGAEEIYPMIGNLRTIARAVGLPYLPMTPTFPWLGPLGLIPMPSKWIIEFGDPISTMDQPPGSAEDPMLVFEIADRVRESIQQALYRLLMQRRSVFT